MFVILHGSHLVWAFPVGSVFIIHSGSTILDLIQIESFSVVCLSRNISISSNLSNLLVYSLSQYSFKILFISYMYNFGIMLAVKLFQGFVVKILDF